MGDWSKNFSKNEFECRDCCKKFVQVDDLVETLQAIRDYINLPILITSGTRCEKKNKKLLNSVPNSAHLTGEAADIYIPNMSQNIFYKKVKEAFNKGLLPKLTYCYMIKSKSKLAIHIGVDKKQRNSIFGSD